MTPLAAATRIVRADGPGALTMDRLARELGVSRSTVYRQTGGLASLLAALDEAGVDVGERADRRDRILAGARTVFGRVGFDAASIEQIAEAAGVGPATVYRHFGDKDGLVAAVMDGLAPRRAARDAIAYTGELAHDLETFATAVLRGMRDDAAGMRLLLLEAVRGGETLARVRAAARARSVAAVASLLRRYRDLGELRVTEVETLAEVYAGMLFAVGVLTPILHGDRRETPKDTARTLTDLFLHGARARKGRGRQPR